jgi:hypothetical protein
MTWTPVDDSQTGGWTGVSPGPVSPWASAGGSNIPSWSAIAVAIAGAFQLGAFQPAYQIANVSNTWTPVNDSQISIWIPVP